LDISIPPTPPSPSETEKPKDSRKTIVATHNESLAESFVERLEIEQELKNVNDKPSGSTKRAGTMLPNEFEKLSQIPRKSLAPTAELSESFVQQVEIQKKLVNMEDKPIAAHKRAGTMMPSEIEKFTKSRKTLAAEPEDEDVSEDFAKYVEIQKKLVNVDDKPVVRKHGEIKKKFYQFGRG
jgi:hypothetical protein